MKEMAELSDKEYKVIIKKCFNKQLQIYLKQFFIKIESQQRNRGLMDNQI